MRCPLEIVSRRGDPASANEILFAPMDRAPSYRRTRVYDIEYSGSRDALRRFVAGVLLDEVAEDARFEESFAYPQARAVLDVSLKPGLLDLEKEYIVDYARSHASDDFRLEDIRIAQRYYIDAPIEPVVLDRIRRDLVNPAIQECRVHG